MDLLHRVDPISGIYLFSSYTEGSNLIDPSWTLVSTPFPNPNPFQVLKINFITMQWEEGVTQEQLDRQAKDAIIAKYEAHKANGWNAYQEIRAKIVLDISKGLISEIDAFAIESNLTEAFSKIANAGDWKTSKFLLAQLSPYPPLVQAYYDLAMQVITDYITNNYDS